MLLASSPRLYRVNLFGLVIREADVVVYGRPKEDDQLYGARKRIISKDLETGPSVQWKWSSELALF